MDGVRFKDNSVCSCDIGQRASVTDYVNEGMQNWLNNKPKQAEQFLKSRIDNTSVLAAYSFVLCMVGGMRSQGLSCPKYGSWRAIKFCDTALTIHAYCSAEWYHFI